MAEPTKVSYDPGAWDFYPRMHEVYDQLRTADPVHWFAQRREWVLTRHAEVQAVLRDPEMYPMQVHAGIAEVTAKSGLRLPALHQAVEAATILSSPPGHLLARKLHMRVINARPLAELAPIVDRCARHLLDAARQRGGLDAVQDFAAPLPYYVISELLGIPHEDTPLLVENSLDVFPQLMERVRDPAQYRDLNARAAVALDYLGGLLEERRRAPREDGLSRIIECNVGESVLSNRQLAASIYFLFVAGFETVGTLLARSILAFCEFPAEAERWRRGEVADDSAVEELLRYITPAHQTIRQAKHPATLAGKSIQPDQALILVLAAANRDPAVFPNPHQLDLGRARTAHISFGDGVHACVGAALARLETRIALKAYLELPLARRTTTTLEWGPFETIRKFKSLPLTLT